MKRTRSCGLFKAARIITMTLKQVSKPSHLFSQQFSPHSPLPPPPKCSSVLVHFKSGAEPRASSGRQNSCHRSAHHCRHFLGRSLNLTQTHNDRRSGALQSLFGVSVVDDLGRLKCDLFCSSWHHKDCAWTLWIHMEVQTLRLAVGVALVPVGALVTLTADNREREKDQIMTCRYFTIKPCMNCVWH